MISLFLRLDLIKYTKLVQNSLSSIFCPVLELQECTTKISKYSDFREMHFKFIPVSLTLCTQYIIYKGSMGSCSAKPKRHGPFWQMLTPSLTRLLELDQVCKRQG